MNRWWTLGLVMTLSGAPGAFTCPQVEICDGEDNDGDGAIDEGFDADSDGYQDADACEGGPGEVDCDDSDPEVNPGAQEICNLLDDDCDGVVDEGVAGDDLDGDGISCQFDCDDDDSGSFPGAPEACDGADNDCDGAYDEDFDGDGDGVATCAGDCDDERGDIYPGAAEVLGDGVDNDCDGRSDATTIVTADGSDPEPGKPLFQTIQGAIDNAINGEIIAIYGGTYQEALDLQGKGVTLVGVAGAEETIVDARKATRGLLIQGGQGDRAVIRGLTFKGGSEMMGAGALIDGTSPRVAGCRFQGNQGDLGGGVALVNGASPTFESVYIGENNARLGGGIYVDGASEVTLLDPVIQVNSAYGLGDVTVVEIQGSDGESYDVLRWLFEGQGGGVYLGAGARADIQGGSIELNYALEGGGIFHEGAGLTLLGTSLVGNEAKGVREELKGEEIPEVGERHRYLGAGGGLYLAGPARLESLVLRGNLSIYGGAIALEAGADVAMVDISTSGNEGFGPLEETLAGGERVTDFGGGGGALAALGGVAALEGSTFQRDRGLYGGSVFVDGGDLTLRGAILLEPLAQGVIREDTAHSHTVLGGLGGGIFHREGALQAESVIVNGGQAYQGGGGVYLSGEAQSAGGVLLSNLTVVGGSAPIGGGIALDTGEGDILMRNLIVAFSAQGGGIRGPIPDGGLTYSDVYGNGGGDVPGGEDILGAFGNISQDPLFISYGDGDGPEDDSLKLGLLSPGRDGGDPSTALQDPDGSRGDMGAYGGPGANALP